MGHVLSYELGEAWVHLKLLCIKFPNGIVCFLLVFLLPMVPGFPLRDPHAVYGIILHAVKWSSFRQTLADSLHCL